MVLEQIDIKALETVLSNTQFVGDRHDESDDFHTGDIWNQEITINGLEYTVCFDWMVTNTFNQKTTVSDFQLYNMDGDSQIDLTIAEQIESARVINITF